MAAGRYPRLYVSPALRIAVANNDRPGWLLAAAVGIHHGEFSTLINADSIPDSPLNVERLKGIAKAVGFPVEELFLASRAAVQAASPSETR